MTVAEMIEALQALEMPDALVVRGDNRDNPPRIYHERGDMWDVVLVRQDERFASGQWFLTHYDEAKDESGYKVKWAVVL